MTSLSHNFWNYSLQVYAKDSIMETCLELQNSYGFDVNLLLFCLWYGHYHGELSNESLGELLGFSKTWRAKVVHPLRESRRWMKQHRSEFDQTLDDSFCALREKIKKDELAAEKYQQETMQAIALRDVADDCGEAKGSREDATSNLLQIRKHCMPDFNPEGNVRLNKLLDRLIANIEPGENK